MENHHSVMVIGGLCKMDLNSIAQISLHRRLMAKQRNKNLLPLVADGSNREVRGCRHECEHRSALAAREGLSGWGSTLVPISWHSCLPPPALPLTGGDRFYLQKVFQKHQIFMLTLKKKQTWETTPKLKL